MINVFVGKKFAKQLLIKINKNKLHKFDIYLSNLINNDVNDYYLHEKDFY